MKPKLFLPGLLILFSILLVTACDGGDAKSEARKKCYDTYGACLKACEDAFSRALEEDIACRNKCNTDYLAALEKCQSETDPAKRRKCEKDALDALTKCLEACTTKFMQAMQTNKECRAKCETDLAECLRKL